MRQSDYPILVGFGQTTQKSDDPLTALEPIALAATLAIEPRDRVYTSVGGNSPQYLINQTADEIASGKIRLALLAGAEAMYAQRLALLEEMERREMIGAPGRVESGCGGDSTNLWRPA